MDILPAEQEIMNVKANTVLTRQEKNREIMRLKYHLKKQELERMMNKIREIKERECC